MNEPDTTAVVIAPDSFKGCLPASAVAAAVARGLQQQRPALKCIQRPLADGGEGTLDCVTSAVAASRHGVTVNGVHTRAVRAEWLTLADGTAVIESAQALGLPLVEHAGGPPLRQRGSFGLGQLIGAALDAGCRRLIVGLGGSACQDAGLGMLQALGMRFTDAAGVSVGPNLDGLLRVAGRDAGVLDARLADTELVVLHDVDNPLVGSRGAAAVFGPQKGLAGADVAPVDVAMQRFAGLWPGGAAQATRPGAGAAGGLGFALARLGGRLTPGAQHLIDLTGLAAAIAHADWVVTGEGRSDTQTLGGKLPLAVAHTARQCGRPTALLSGAIDPGARAALAAHFATCLDLVSAAGGTDAALQRAAHWLQHCAAALPKRMAAAPSQ